MKKLYALFIILFAASVTVTAQKKVNYKKLMVTNATKGVVYYNENTVLYKPGSYLHDDYIIELHFNNPVVKIDKKEPINVKFDTQPNKSYVLLDYYFVSVFADGDVQKSITLDTVITFSCWDSTIVKEDKYHPGTMISAPEIRYFRIGDGRKKYNSLQLHLPAGTFTDSFGNKNEDMNLTFQKRKK